MSLQEEARRRAEALRAQHQLTTCYDSDSSGDNDALFAAANALETPVSAVSAAPFASFSSQPQQPPSSAYWNPNALKLAATQSTSPASSATTQSSLNLNKQSPQQYYQQQYYQQQQHEVASTARPPTTSMNIAAQARKDWQNHGTGISQALEQVRMRGTDNNIPRVRVFATAAKVDAAGQDYTAYLIRVETGAAAKATPKNQNDSNFEITIVEHRFSDFYKLQQTLETADVHVDVAFPSRLTWAGRLGNWTPAQLLAPDRHSTLIQYRLQQLDAWLVHVVQLAPTMPTTLREAVWQFLQATAVLPCQQPLRLTTTHHHHAGNSSTPKKSSSSLVMAATDSLHWINPVTFTMGSALRQACRSVETLCHLPASSAAATLPNDDASSVTSLAQASSTLGTMPEADHTIPLDLLRVARGILFVTVVKAGWVVSGRIGTGLLVQRLNGTDQTVAEWSAPAAIGTFGMGWGILAGADVTHYMVIFTADSAVRDLVQQSTTIQVGAELSAAMGPLGRSANSHLQSGDWTVHTAYAYAHSQGLFVGVSLEGSLWQVRHDVNAKFYGQRNIEAIHLLHQPGPPAAQPLYDRLALALSHQHQLAASSSWLPSPTPRSVATTTGTTSTMYR